MQGLNFNTGIVKKGTKTQSEATSTIELLSTVGNFRLNNKAMAELGVAIGDSILFIDMFGAETQADRYFICNGEKIEGAAKLGTNRIVSNANVYNSMLLGKPDVKSASRLDLEKEGLLLTTPKSVISKHNIVCDLVAYQDGELVEVGGQEVKVFQFTNFVFDENKVSEGEEETELEEAED